MYRHLLIVILGFIAYNYITVHQSYVLHTCSYDDNFLTNYYHHYKNRHLGDSGIDLMIPHDINIPPLSYQKIDYYTQFVMTNSWNYDKSYSYFLFARSSMQNIPLIFVNGVGIIDAGFRGNLSSFVYNPTNYNILLVKGQKIVQICGHDLSEIKVIVNCNIKSYGTRGSNGFGSTNVFP